MRNNTAGWSRVAITAAVLASCTFGVSGLATGRVAGGHGKRGDCYAEFDGIDSTRGSGQPRVDCEAGDPACATPTDCHSSCTFKVGVCINQSDLTGCTPPTGGLKKLKALPNKYKGLVAGLDLTQPVCSTPTEIVVKTHKGAKSDKPGRQQLRLFATAQAGAKPGIDSDVVTLVCNPRPSSEACPTTTTTTSTTSTTTTTAP